MALKTFWKSSSLWLESEKFYVSPYLDLFLMPLTEVFLTFTTQLHSFHVHVIVVHYVAHIDKNGILQQKNFKPLILPLVTLHTYIIVKPIPTWKNLDISISLYDPIVISNWL